MTTKDKIAKIDAILAKDDGTYLNDICREVGISSRRYDMIKQQERQQTAITFLLSNVSASVRAMYLEMTKPKEKNFNRRTAIQKARLLCDNKENQ